MSSKIIFLLLTIVGLGFTQPGLSQRTISGIQIQTVKKGNLQINNTATFPTFLKIYNQKSNTMIDLPETFVRTEVSLRSNLIYGINNALNLFLDIPFQWRNHYSPDLNQKNHGFGDLWFGGYYQFNRNWNSRIFFVAPTGKSNNLKQTELPLGEGAFQVGAALNGTFNLLNIPIVVSANYIYRNKNKQKINLGDIATFQFSTYNNIRTDFGNFAYEFGVIYEYKFKDQLNNNSLPQSSFTHLSLFPGFDYYYSDHLRFGFSIPVSVYHRKSWLTDYAIVLNLDLIIEKL